MSRSTVMMNLASGAAAGFVGTLALQALRAVGGAVAPGAEAPIRQDPGAFVVASAERALPAGARRRVPGWAEAASAQGLAIGYGLTFGTLYAALRPEGGPTLTDGVALGLTTWATGYLGWLSALGLMPPLRRQRPGQILVPVLQHAAYGVVTVAAYDRIRRRIGGAGPSTLS